MRGFTARAFLLYGALCVGCSGSVGEQAGPGGRQSADNPGGTGGQDDPNQGSDGGGIGGDSGFGGDAGAPGTGGVPGTGGAIEPPADLIPMFVSVGRGGRTITSCDDGRTWINDRQLSDNNGDHEDVTDKGFAYGDGKFVQLLGWGAPRSLQISEDGLTWRRVYPEGSDWATIGFLGDTFMMMNGNEAVTSDTPDGPWIEVTDHGCDGFLREGGGGGPAPGIMMGACGPRYTTDQGQSWQTAAACSAANSFGGIGHRGGFVFGAGVFVVMDDEGDYCSTPDMGTSWRSGRITSYRDGPIAEVGKLFFANGEFWAMVGPKGHRSPDGINWSTTEFLPKDSGVILHAIAASDAGTYVAYDRTTGQFYRSTDARVWQKTAKRDATPMFQRLLFGYGNPSAQCPLL